MQLRNIRHVHCRLLYLELTRAVRSHHLATLSRLMAKLPNLRRLFASFRTEEEEREYSRSAFFNFVGFLGTCALFSLIAQKANGK